MYNIFLKSKKNLWIQKKKKKQTHRYRDQTSGYQRGQESRGRLYTLEEIVVIMGIYKIMCMNLLQMLKLYWI